MDDWKGWLGQKCCGRSWRLWLAVAGIGSWAQAVSQSRHICGQYRHRATWAGFLQ